MNGWHKVGQLEELQNDSGDSLVYGEYGPETYGLYTSIDGREVCICARSIEDADDILKRLASGWRPVNWTKSIR